MSSFRSPYCRVTQPSSYPFSSHFANLSLLTALSVHFFTVGGRQEGDATAATKRLASWKWYPDQSKWGWDWPAISFKWQWNCLYKFASNSPIPSIHNVPTLSRKVWDRIVLKFLALLCLLFVLRTKADQRDLGSCNSKPCHSFAELPVMLHLHMYHWQIILSIEILKKRGQMSYFRKVHVCCFLALPETTPPNWRDKSISNPLVLITWACLLIVVSSFNPIISNSWQFIMCIPDFRF